MVHRGFLKTILYEGERWYRLNLENKSVQELLHGLVWHSHTDKVWTAPKVGSERKQYHSIERQTSLKLSLELVAFTKTLLEKDGSDKQRKPSIELWNNWSLQTKVREVLHWVEQYLRSQLLINEKLTQAKQENRHQEIESTVFSYQMNGLEGRGIRFQDKRDNE